MQPLELGNTFQPFGKRDLPSASPPSTDRNLLVLRRAVFFEDTIEGVDETSFGLNGDGFDDKGDVGDIGVDDSDLDFSLFAF